MSAHPGGLIPIYRPSLSARERELVLDCMDTGWISSQGAYVGRFEEGIVAATGARNAIAIANGSVALHLAVHALGVGPGDEVIVPAFTYIASINAIAMTGATPVLADSGRDDWLLDAEDVAARITPRTRAIMPVHLYGAVADVAGLAAVAGPDIAIVEDCAESFGARRDGRHSGLAGRIGSFSFFANKTITTGEGGALVTDDDALAARLKRLRNHGQPLNRRYWHEELGFNYRMTNICAAIGVAQIERLPAILAAKARIEAVYRAELADLPLQFQAGPGATDGAPWLVTFLLPRGVDRARLIATMMADGVESRAVFTCAHRMPMYAGGERLPVAEDIEARGLSLPSFPDLTEAELGYVVRVFRRALLQAEAAA